MREAEHPAKLSQTLVVSFFNNLFTISHKNLSAKNAEVHDDAIKALITWWQQIDFKADYINSWAKGEADIMEIRPFNIFKLP